MNDLTNSPSDIFHHLWPCKNSDILCIFGSIPYYSCKTDKLVSMLVRHLKEDMDQVLKKKRMFHKLNVTKKENVSKKFDDLNKKEILI